MIRGLVVAVLGLVPGFFLVGPLLFADGPVSERLVGLAGAAGVYLVLGGLAGYWGGAWWTGIWLGAPAALLAVLLGEYQPLSFFVGVVAVAAACAGAYGGVRLRLRRD